MSELANMTVTGAAVRLGCTLTHVYNLLRTQRLPGAFKHDGVWKVPESAVLAYKQGVDRRRTRHQGHPNGPDREGASSSLKQMLPFQTRKPPNRLRDQRPR
jgi:excisionase family DNA binding protein